MGRRWSWVALAVVLSACSLRGARRDPVSRRLRKLDARFAQRADPESLSAAVSGYLDLASTAEDDARVLARVSRAYLVLGMAEPDRSAEHWQVAREVSLRCLMTGSGFSGRVSAAGGRVVASAAERIPEVHAGCAVWGGLAWARQVEARGAGGVALDLAPLRAMARRAEEVARTPAEKSGAAQLRGLAEALPPDVLGPDFAAAGAAFDAAGAKNLLARVDEARLVRLRQGDTAGARELLQGVLQAEAPEAGWLPEDAYALQQAATLLGTMP